MTWTYWWKKDTRTLNISWWRGIRKRNKREYGDEPDINTKMIWGIHTNGAEKGNPEHTCLDWSLNIGHLEINFINWNYNESYRV